MSSNYPRDRHLLRDLRLSFEHSEQQMSRAWLPVVPEVCAADGAVRAGAPATLVDVVGGGLAATVAHPNWIATAGRTTVVIEVDLRDDSDTEIGIATMSFAVLPRRADNPDVTAEMTSGTMTTGTTPSGRSTMALVTSGTNASLLDQLEVRVVSAVAGVLEAPIGEWSRNALGAMQGGAVATIADAAAEVAARAAGADGTGEALIVTDLQLTYLALARVGPIRTRVDGIVVRVEVRDEGARRVTALAVVTSARMTRSRMR